MSEQQFLEAVGELDTELVAEYLTMREERRAYARLLLRMRRMELTAALSLGVCAALLTVAGVLLSVDSEGVILMESTVVAPWLFVAAAACLMGAVGALVISLHRRK